jgi:actin-related protein
VRDWDQMEKLWQRIMDKIGLTAPDSASVLIVESPKATVAERSKWAEMLFEKSVPSICFGNSSPLSLFASGRTTGMVVECGAGLTSVAPIFEGLSLTHANISMDYGGQDITSNFRTILTQHQHPIDYVDARMLKEKMAEVYVPSKDMVYHAPTDTRQFELPDGTQVKVPKKVFTDCTEPLFRNDRGFPAGLIVQAYEALRLCDDSIRKDLSQNVVVAGGTSMLPGLGDRLQTELQQRINAEAKANKGFNAYDVRVVPNSGHRCVCLFVCLCAQSSLCCCSLLSLFLSCILHAAVLCFVLFCSVCSESGYTHQRRIAAWIGGSIVSSIQDTYREIKITKQEWDEEKENSILTKSF